MLTLIKIPEPTVVVDSGRGIYLLWLVEEHVNAMPRWIKMQKYLYEQLQELGADPQVTTDCARVLRKIGSINSKTGNVVTVMECHSEHKYCLSNLIRQYLPDDDVATDKMISYSKWIADSLNIDIPGDDKNTLRKFIKENKDAASKVSSAPFTMIKYAKWIYSVLGKGFELPSDLSLYEVKKYIAKHKDAANLVYQTNQKNTGNQGNKSNKIHYIYNESSLYIAKTKDLETLLLKHRDREGGYREYILFLYRYYKLCLTDSFDESLDATLKLNEQLNYPLDVKEVVEATKSAVKYYKQGKVYKRTNKHIIDKLEITDAEMMDLKCLVSSKVSHEKKKYRNRIAYLDRLKEENKITKAEQIKQRRENILELISEGKSQIEICRILNISKSTFYEDKKALECTSNCDAFSQSNQESQDNQDNKEEPIIDVTSDDTSTLVLTCPKNSALDINMTFRSIDFGLSYHDSA